MIAGGLGAWMIAMKRSEINRLILSARACFESHGWVLPPVPKWDVTDFGKGDWREFGLVLVNLCEEPEYCEKLMFALQGMKTPTHAHRIKKEDIICRWGAFRIDLTLRADVLKCVKPQVKIDGVRFEVSGGESFEILAGSRITLPPGLFHEFQPTSPECIFGEVSTANDDLTDNVFLDAGIGRFSQIEEDEAAVARLVSEI
jgi:D-lyxose ketol-isomerase